MLIVWDSFNKTWYEKYFFLSNTCLQWCQKTINSQYIYTHCLVRWYNETIQWNTGIQTRLAGNFYLLPHQLSIKTRINEFHRSSYYTCLFYCHIYHPHIEATLRKIFHLASEYMNQFSWVRSWNIYQGL